MRFVRVGGMNWSIEPKLEKAMDKTIDAFVMDVQETFPEKEPRDIREVALKVMTAYITQELEKCS